jgi:hypothetical protein
MSRVLSDSTDSTDMWRLVTDPNELIAAASAFIASLSAADLSARGYADHASYRAAMRASLLSRMDPDDFNKLDVAVQHAGASLAKYRRIGALPWSIAVVGHRTHAVEGGWPHTHGGLVVLPLRVLRDMSVVSLVETLVHEKVHVYQRAYPAETHVLLMERWGLQCMGRRRGDELRSNPDINGFVYGVGACVCAQVYASSQPRALWQSRIRCTAEKPPGIAAEVLGYEHPFEAMAYMVASIVIECYGHADHSDTHARAAARQWMREFL